MHHEAEVKLIAYEIWEREGRPDGKDQEHWQQAEAIWADRQLPQQAENVEEPAAKRPRRSTTTTRRRTATRQTSKRES